MSRLAILFLSLVCSLGCVADDALGVGQGKKCVYKPVMSDDDLTYPNTRLAKIATSRPPIRYPINASSITNSFPNADLGTQSP